MEQYADLKETDNLKWTELFQVVNCLGKWDRQPQTSSMSGNRSHKYEFSISSNISSILSCLAERFLSLQMKWSSGIGHRTTKKLPQWILVSCGSHSTVSHHIQFDSHFTLVGLVHFPATVSLSTTYFNNVSIVNNGVVKLVLVLDPTSAALTRVQRSCICVSWFLTGKFSEGRQPVTRTFRFA